MMLMSIVRSSATSSSSSSALVSPLPLRSCSSVCLRERQSKNRGSHVLVQQCRDGGRAHCCFLRLSFSMSSSFISSSKAEGRIAPRSPSTTSSASWLSLSGPAGTAPGSAAAAAKDRAPAQRLAPHPSAAAGRPGSVIAPAPLLCWAQKSALAAPKFTEPAHGAEGADADGRRETHRSTERMAVPQNVYITELDVYASVCAGSKVMVGGGAFLQHIRFYIDMPCHDVSLSLRSPCRPCGASREKSFTALNIIFCFRLVCFFLAQIKLLVV